MAKQGAPFLRRALSVVKEPPITLDEIGGFSVKWRKEEYYPNALISKYKGVSGYIYSAKTIADSGFALNIPDAAASSAAVDVSGVEFIPDAYEAILQAEREGLIAIRRYEEMTDKTREWNRRTIPEEYENASDHPEYRHFLKGNFPEMLNGR